MDHVRSITQIIFNTPHIDWGIRPKYKYNLYNVPHLPPRLRYGVACQSEVLHGILDEDGDVLVLEVDLAAHGSLLQTVIIVCSRN